MGARPTLVSTSGRGGQAISGCGVATFRIQTEPGSLQIEVPEVDEMRSCPPGRVDALTGHYPSALERVDQASADGASLILEGEDVELRFESVGGGVSEPRGPTTFEELLDECASGMGSPWAMDHLWPPNNAEEAQDWPRSADEAAKRTFDSLLFPSESDLNLSEGRTVVVDVPVDESGSREGDTAVEFLVEDPQGTLVGVVTVKEVGYGAFATTQVDRCSL